MDVLVAGVTRAVGEMEVRPGVTVTTRAIVCIEDPGRQRSLLMAAQNNCTKSG